MHNIFFTIIVTNILTIDIQCGDKVQTRKFYLSTCDSCSNGISVLFYCTLQKKHFFQFLSCNAITITLRRRSTEI